MPLLELFRTYLLTQGGVSSLTAKNYVSDLRRFLSWFESSFSTTFQPSDLTVEVITLFTKTQGGQIVNHGSLIVNPSPTRSFERYLATLRKFAEFLLKEGLISQNPFEIINRQSSLLNKDSDPWFLKEFKDYLYVYGASKSTIKNYIIDVNTFTAWIEESQIKSQPAGINVKNYIKLITGSAIDDYKERLISVLNFSPRSVNRKLSSIRRYLQFAQAQGHMSQFETLPAGRQVSNFPFGFAQGKQFQIEKKQKKERGRLSLSDFRQEENNMQPTINNQYSRIPPIRLLQKLLAPYFNLEDSVASYIARSISNSRLRRVPYGTRLRRPPPKQSKTHFFLLRHKGQ